MTEADASSGLKQGSAGVWPAMMQRIPHLVEHTPRIGLKPAGEVNEASNSAHRTNVNGPRTHARGILGIGIELRVSKLRVTGSGGSHGDHSRTAVLNFTLRPQFGFAFRAPPEQLL